MDFVFNKTAKLWLCCSFFLSAALTQAQVKWEYYLIDAITQKPIVNLEVRDFNGVSTRTDERGFFKLESEKIGIQFSDLGYFLDCPNCVPNQDTSGVDAKIWYLIPMDFYTLKAIQIGQNENVRSEMLTSSSSLVLLGSEGRFSFDGSSLQSAFNAIPGVQFDSRGYGGSSRISLRGSFLRSPFAVRNLKMYLNGIALTNPDGQSPLEMLDLSYLGQMEVTKGPAGALFGSGHGGIIQLQLPAIARNHLLLEAGSSVGDFGYRKGFIQASGTEGKLSYGIHVNSQATNGYRQQEWNFRENILGNLSWNGKSNHKLIFIHYRGGWGLPGALNANQVIENPTQAVPFALTNNTSVSKWRDMIGYTLDKRWKSQTIQFSANAYTSEKWNPYGTSAANSGDKTESTVGGGFRAIYTRSWNLPSNLTLQNQAGSECQFEYLDFYEKSLTNGIAGDLKMSFESYALNWNVFEQISLIKKNAWNIHGSLGTNATPTVSNGTNYVTDPPFQDLDSKVNYELKLYPRIGASVQLNNHLFATGNWTKGNSAPSIFEQLDYNTNSINILSSEYSSNTELGVKASWKFFQTGVAIYNQKITNAIVVADTVIDGLPRSFVNSNGTIQRGLEWQCNAVYQSDHLNFNLWNNGSWNAFQYASNTQGNRLPGVPLCQVNSGLSGEWEFDRYAAKLGVNLVHQWTDKTPLNNNNSAWASARQLLNLDCFVHLPFYKTTQESSHLNSIEVKRVLGSIRIHAGINNATNTTYTSFYQVNGFGGKFFNPMPLRNYYAGLAIRFMM